MPAHKITGFLGIMPRTSERLLPDMAAQIAENVTLTSGEIRPMKKPALAYGPGTVAQMYAAYRAYNGTTEKWRTWQFDVDVAKGSLSPDVEQRYYWTGDGCPRYATFTNWGTTDWALGMPAPTSALTASPSGGTGLVESRFYAYTFINALGEESSASPVSALVSGKVDATWTISGFSAAPTNDRTINYNQTSLKQRLYRTAGSTGAFQLVAERAASSSNWSDTVTTSNMMGDDLITDGWSVPPVDLKGIISLPNGAMAAFRGNQLLFSEPYQPHAWPTSYRYECESEIVGIAAYGTTVVVCTKTRPYIADGVDPSVVTLQSVTDTWPCLSKASVCSVGDGVVFSTKHGLAYIGLSGNKIITIDVFAATDWADLGPATMVCRSTSGRLFLLYKPPSGSQTQLLRIDLLEGGTTTTLTADANTLYVDPLNGDLYVVKKEVYLYDGLYGSRNTFVWKSKQIEMSDPVNFGAGLIEWVGSMTPSEIQAAYALRDSVISASQGTITGKTAVGAFNQLAFNAEPINGANGIATPPDPAETLTYTLFDKNDSPIFSTPVFSGEMFRMPAGYKLDVFAHQLTGNVRVRYLKIGETPLGLKMV
jgi:hypothetical protein